MRDPLVAIADDLFPGQPFYIIRASDEPPEHLTFPGSWGCTSRSFDLSLMHWLKSIGRWEGRRPCVYINDVALQREAWSAAPTEAEADALLDEITATIFVHELAHVAECPIDLAEPTPERETLALSLAAFAPAFFGNAELPPWAGHRAPFIRLALHLYFRATRLQHDIRANTLFCGESYGLPSIFAFSAALGDEPERLEQVPIGDIRDIPPPQRFIGLWETATNERYGHDD